MNSFLMFLQSLPSLVPANTNFSPTLFGLLALDVYLIFYVTRDALLRIRPFFPQLLCILLVAVLPGVGFLLYLLVRPARLIKERALEEMLLELLDRTESQPTEEQEPEPLPPPKQKRPTEGRLIAALPSKKVKKKQREPEDEGSEEPSE